MPHWECTVEIVFHAEFAEFAEACRAPYLRHLVLPKVLRILREKKSIVFVQHENLLNGLPEHLSHLQGQDR